MSLYTAPFLDGFYPEWRRRVRGLGRRPSGPSWQANAGTALEVLSAEASARGEHRLAADWWRRLLELDPLSSHAALGLMTALDHAGEHAEALRLGEAYGELVRSELGADPPPELSEWIEQHRHVAGNGARSTNSPPADRVRSGRPVRPRPMTPPRARRAGRPVRRWGAAIGLAALAAAGLLLSGSRTDLADRPQPRWPSPPSTCSIRRCTSGTRGWWTSSPGTSTAPDRCAPSRRRWDSSAGSGRADRVSAESFGHRTGAGLVVFGSVRKTRDTVSLRATVLDLATEAGRARSRGQR